MALVTITKHNADETAAGNAIVFLEFWTDWCPSSRAFHPVYMAAAQRHQDLVFGQVNLDEQRELGRKFGVTAIPTTVALKHNTVVAFNVGSMSDQQLSDLIRDVRTIGDGGGQRRTVRAGVIGGARPVRPQ